MTFELEEPFKSLWNRAFFQIHPSGRKYVSLYNSDTDRSLISYARYLMSVKLSYLVPEGYEVDHVDDDKTNDDINNLQILTSEENKLKEEWRYVNQEQICYGYECAYCDTRFILTEGEVNKRLSTNVEMAFCSRHCAAKYHNGISGRCPNPAISADVVIQIKELRKEGLSAYKISEITGVSRSTVMRYW